MSEPFTYPQTDAESSPGPTPSQTVGPFFGFALPYDAGPRLAGPARAGTVLLSGAVLDGEGAPVPDALVEIWQPDEEGRLTPSSPEPILHEVTAAGFRGFGRCATDAAGRYAFTTVRPGPAPTRDGHAQAPHVALSVFARGMLRQVVTRVYFPEDGTAHRDDPLLSPLPPARRATLMATHRADGYGFDVHIQGEQETVFLDVFAR